MPLPPLNTIITTLHDVYDTMDERPQTAKLDLGTFINVLVTERQHPLRLFVMRIKKTSRPFLSGVPTDLHQSSRWHGRNTSAQKEYST